jgi:NAD-dependent deacetylase
MSELDAILGDIFGEPGRGRVVVLTGAGISAESGIATFRGDDGFWTVGSTNYRPEDLATWRTFSSDPEVVWPWYLYRLAACRAAEPNEGHRALVRLQAMLGQRMVLITQNVDGLHLRAGSNPQRTWEIHGNLERFRCAGECSLRMWPCPTGLRTFARADVLTDEDLPFLRCPDCGDWARPHVLWFDECYDEERFRWQSSLNAAATADLLLVVGTSGATNLPMSVGAAASRAGAAIIDVNPVRNPFSAFAEASACGLYLEGSAGDIVPDLVGRIARRIQTIEP